MRKLLCALLMIPAILVGYAGAASATNGSLSFSQDCNKVYVTVVSHYAEGPLHINIDAPVNGGGDVAPLATKVFPFGWNGATTYHVEVSSSNGLLNGQPAGLSFPHDFVKDAGCTTPTTPTPTTPPSTTCSGAIPPRDDCGTTTVPAPSTTVAGPCVTAPQPDQPGYDACGDCSTPEICAAFQSTTTTTTAAPPAVAIVRQGPPRSNLPQAPLPATGAGGVLAMTAGAAVLLIVGIALVALVAWSATHRRPPPTWPHVRLERDDRPEGYHRIRHHQPGKS